MGFKSFIMKKALQMKGMDKEQAAQIADALDSNPELATKLKKLEDNKELKSLFEKIQKEVEEKKKTMPEAYATMSVMTKYKEEIAKHREDLLPLMELMGGKM